MLDQLSMPYRIALGALLVLALAWFTVLKPSDDTASLAAAPAANAAPTAPGVTGLTDDVARARGAAAASERVNESTRSAVAAASGDAAATTATTEAAPASSSAAAQTAAARAESADPTAPVLAALDRGDVAVLTFLQPGGADDRQLRSSLRGLTGPVSVHTADIDRVGAYAAITRGVPVLQAPTTLVIGSDHRARVVTGYAGRGELQQLVDDQAGH